MGTDEHEREEDPKPDRPEAGEPEPAASSPDAETSEAEASSAGAEDTPKAVPLLALDSQALVAWFVEVLASRAWVDMGLLADPLTGQVSKKMSSARLAIDAFEGLAKVLKNARPEEARRLEGILTDLRLNFVRQAGAE